MSLPKYAEYKDSGVAWLGEVPTHWKINRLKFGLRLLTDKTARRTNPVALENIESWSGRFLATDTEFQGEGTAFEEGDVLFGKLRPYLAKVLLAESSGEAVGDFHVLRPATGVVPRFAQYQLLSREFIGVVDGSTFGSKMPRASWDFLANLPLVLPDAEEQSAIAAFLDRETGKIDALIAEQEKLLTLLAEKRQATISHAVTRGLNPNAPMKDSGIPWLGEVPAHWRVMPLKYLVSFKSGGTPSKENLDYWDGSVPWASAKDLKSEYLADTSDHLTRFAVDSGAATLFPAGVVLAVVRGMILARIFPVAETLSPMAINQDLKALMPNDGLAASYLAWLLRGTAAESLQRLDEAGHGTKALRMDAWGSMELPVPPEDEQHQIVESLLGRLSAIDQFAADAGSAIDLLKERRSALISAAVTGKIDVRNFAKMPA